MVQYFKVVYNASEALGLVLRVRKVIYISSKKMRKVILFSSEKMRKVILISS